LFGYQPLSDRLFHATQGDQIVRIFAQLAIASFGYVVFRKVQKNPYFWGPLFSTVKAMNVLILTKNGLGYILGDFFTNSSGHPDAKCSSVGNREYLHNRI
jgi:hypothetical protein